MTRLKLAKLNMAYILKKEKEKEQNKRQMIIEYNIRETQKKNLYNNKEKSNILNETKKVRFSDNTKIYDGPELSKQIIECLIYNYIKTFKIQTHEHIKYILTHKYNQPDKITLNKTKELFENTINRLANVPTLFSIKLFHYRIRISQQTPSTTIT